MALYLAAGGLVLLALRPARRAASQLALFA
jgi:hypothetical protein